MVMIGQNLGATLANRKSSSDFTREAEEFEAAKRQRAMAEQLGQIGLEKAQKELQMLTGVFSGNSWDAQVGNVAYEKFLSEGLDPMTAKQRAVDAVLQTKVDYAMVTDPYTGRQTPMAKPRNPVFGDMGQQSIESEPLPDMSGIDPMQAHNAVLDLQARRVSAENQMPANPPMPGQLVPVGGLGEFPQVDERALMDMPAAQGAAMDIDPRAMRAPEVQMDLAKKANEMALKSQDPEVLMKQKEQEEKAESRQRTRSVSADIVTTEADAALAILENRGAFTAGTPAAIAQFFGETDAGKLAQSHLATIKANAGFDKMMQMKQESPTGASGLGQLTQEERKTLEQTIGTLSVTQSPDILENNIRRIHNLYMDGVHGRPEEIRANAQRLGLSPQQVQELTFRYPISRPVPSQKVTKFNSIQEAESANLPKGTEIIINGRRAVVE